MNQIQIRTAIKSDLEGILNIINFNILHSTANYSYETMNFEEIEKWFEEKRIFNFPVFVAENENKVVGFATYGTFRSKIGYKFTVEHSIYVDNKHLNKGIGRLLMPKLIEKAKEQQYHTMIGVIDSENQDSILFHKKFNFDEVGHIKEVGFKFEKWLDLTLMQLIL